MRRFFSFVVCAVLLNTPCLASDAPMTADAAHAQSRKEQAEVHFERGIQEFRAKRYKDAIDAFLLANDLYPSTAISFNIARAYESLQDPADALRFYRDYLRRSPAASDAQAISKRIEELEDRLRQRGVQQVTILSNPPGATLAVDGRSVGITPWTGEILAGNHGILLVLRGYADKLEQFELSSHRAAELEFQLDPLAPTEQRLTPREQRPAPARAAPATPLVPLPQKSVPTVMNYLPWVALGGGALALAGAGYFEMASSKAEERARLAARQPDALAAIRDMQGAQLTSRVFVGVGGGLAATGGLLLWLRSASSEKPATLAFSCGVLGCTTRGTF